MNLIKLDDKKNICYFITKNGVTIIENDKIIGGCSVQEFLNKIHQPFVSNEIIETENSIHKPYIQSNLKYQHIFKNPIAINMKMYCDKENDYIKKVIYLKLPPIISWFDHKKDFCLGCLNNKNELCSLELPNIFNLDDDGHKVCWGNIPYKKLTRNLKGIELHRKLLHIFLSSNFDDSYLGEGEYDYLLKKSPNLIGERIYDN